MNPSHSFFVASICLALLIGATFGVAQGFEPFSGREGLVEVTFGPRYVVGRTITFDGGAKVDTSTDAGFGFGLGYNFNDHLAANFEIAWNSANFRGERTLDTGATQAVSGTVDTSVTQFNLLYNLLKGPITPFFIGGIGFTYIDTNIPNGPPSGVCWWDPWWGYVCGAYQPTQTSTNFAFNVGGGIRWDIFQGLFLRISANQLWIEASNTGTPGFTNSRLDVGFLF